MTAINLLQRLVDRIGQRIFDEGYKAGWAAALAEAQHQSGDEPGGVTWERIARHAEANPHLLSPWLVDSVSCGLHYGTPPTPRQKMKLEWIYFNRFGGKVP